MRKIIAAAIAGLLGEWVIVILHVVRGKIIAAGTAGFLACVLFINLFSFKRLATPTKRAMFLAFLAGVGFLVLDVTVYYLSHWYRFYEFFEKVPTNYGQRYTSYWFIFWLSVVLIAAGIAGSFLYDVTVGRVVTWVKKGNNGA